MKFQAAASSSTLRVAGRRALALPCRGRSASSPSSIPVASSTSSDGSLTSLSRPPMMPPMLSEPAVSATRMLNSSSA